MSAHLKISLFCLLVLVSTCIAGCCNKPRDCEDLLHMGFKKNGVYKIFPERQTGGIRVYCDMLTAGGGWTVIQRRTSALYSFYQNWNTYENGFGNVNSNHWLGNQFIYKLTDQDGYQLRITMRHANGTLRFALYNHFRLFDADKNYRLLVNGYSGNAGDSLLYHNGRQFSTHDMDNDIWPNNCASKFHGAWWYGKCHQSNLNGKWGSTTYGEGLNWLSLTGYHSSLKSVVMSVRRYNP